MPESICRMPINESYVDNSACHRALMSGFHGLGLRLLLSLVSQVGNVILIRAPSNCADALLAADIANNCVRAHVVGRDDTAAVSFHVIHKSFDKFCSGYGGRGNNYMSMPFKAASMRLLVAH